MLVSFSFRITPSCLPTIVPGFFSVSLSSATMNLQLLCFGASSHGSTPRVVSSLSRLSVPTAALFSLSSLLFSTSMIRVFASSSLLNDQLSSPVISAFFLRLYEESHSAIVDSAHFSSKSSVGDCCCSLGALSGLQTFVACSPKTRGLKTGLSR